MRIALKHLHNTAYAGETLGTVAKPVDVAEVAILVYGFDQGAASVPFALKSLNAAQPHLPTDPRGHSAG